MGAQHRFDLGGGDVLAAAADDLLLAANEIEQAALVTPRHVAGMVPAAAIGLGGDLGAIEIADIELGAADQRLAGLA